MSGYFRQTIIGLSWMSAFRIFSRLVAFIRVVVLARLLAPSEFGIFGIASISLALLEILTETGINVFLVQEKGKIEKYVNDAWLISIIRGVLIAAFIMLFSPFVVTFFKIPESIGLISLIGIVPLIRGFINPAEVKFQKELQFSKEFYFRTVIFSLDSLVAIVVSLITHNAIGLVLGLIAGATLEVILSFILIKPVPVLIFDWRKINRIFHKGKWVTFYGILNYAASEGDNITIGKILGPGFLGIYQMGYTIATLPISEIADVTNKVTFPVYSKISQDVERLKKGFIKTLSLVSIVSILLGTAIFFFPRELFILLFSEKWADTVTVLKPLVIYGIIRGISGTTSSLFLSVGKQKYIAGMTFLRLTVLAATILPFTVTYGIMGASYSVLLSGIIEIPLIVRYVWLVFKTK